MRRVKAFIGIAIAGGVLATVVHGQNSTKPQTAVHASVGDITDTRTTSRNGNHSQCKIELTFTGDAASDAVCVKDVNIDEALDETGRDLRTSEAQGNWNEFSSFENVDRPLSTELVLKNPSRNATLIQTLKGEAELFVPNESNGGIVRLKDFLKTSAKPVANPVLKKFGITVSHLTLQDIKSFIKSGPTKGVADADANVTRFSREELKELEADYQNFSDSQTSVFMLVTDPESKILTLGLQDAHGKRIPWGTSATYDDVREFVFETVPPENSQLVIWLAAPDSVKTCPFEFHNIPLP